MFHHGNEGEPLTMDDAPHLAEAPLGLDDFRVLAVDEGPAGVGAVEATTDVDIRDRPCFGCPARSSG
jgi:hypothetical protein